MAKTKISWCDYTFNCWRGCSTISAGCERCYAERMAKRNPKVFGTWGPNGVRVVASDAYWKLPLKWNRAAVAAGLEGYARPRVFCGSMMDVFEDRPELVHWRAQLFELISQTDNLQWMLLTKRPQNVRRLVGELRPYLKWGDQQDDLDPIALPNVWLGATIENQDVAGGRLAHLLTIPARRRFLSLEPLLGQVNLRLIDSMVVDQREPGYGGPGYGLGGKRPNLIHEVILGGESGPNARPCQLDWIEDILTQCKAAGIPAYVKQLGSVWAKEAREAGWPSTTRKGDNPKEWPMDLQAYAYAAKRHPSL